MLKNKNMTKKRRGKGWPPERRAKMRRLIVARKPWLQSTGPKTTAGKAKTRYNALKHGRNIALFRTLRSALYAMYQWGNVEDCVPDLTLMNSS